MGSQIADEELTVLVTGFGPFREQYPVNPSWEIARTLPSHLPALRAKDAKSRDAATSSAAVDTPPVRIQVHPEPIRVNYRVVWELVPSLWDVEEEERGPRADVVVHIGMAGPRPFYCIERRAHRDGYEHDDVDGQVPDGPAERSGDDWIWAGLPEELETDLDAEDILKRWREHSPKRSDLRISDDPGRYLCDFIYYSSLAHLYKTQRPLKVVFLHVPADASETAVARGRELAVNLIRAIVESEMVKRREKKEEGGGEL